MFKELIDALQDSVKPEPITVNGRTFATAKVYEAEPRIAASLQTTTLQSISDYFANKIDRISEDGVFVHVESPTCVSIQRFLDETNRREERLEANYESSTFKFGHKYDQTEFITLLRSQFVPSDAREQVQKFVGSLDDESSVKLSDDGVSQKTVGKTGVASFGNIEIPERLVLAPFRTFSEVEQPEGEFILRLHSTGGTPLISLHEADNQAWKREAIERIAEWLKTKGEVKVPILA